MLSKYHKSRFKSAGIAQSTSFSCIYICTGCFLSSEVLKKKFIWLLEIYLLKRKKLLSDEMEIVFTELLLSAWRDETSDNNHEEIRSLSSRLIEKNPKVFEPLLFASNSVEEHVKNSKITGTWAETVDIFQLCITPKAAYLYLLNKTEKMTHF